MVAQDIGGGQRAGGGDVSDDALVLIFDSGMGTESRRVSCAFANAWAVSAEGLCIAGGGDMVAGRVANVGKHARRRVVSRV